eukprot:TRINITY_DN55341_c0_g1_i1.p1 TRINITY_DN55341_c0_g1~~TRINITY_DN55341_c0_g1_i1.p1  ORF type:complete len:630 (-),score=38.81 TRINITY_DN55341_c0_g1_i1:56-1945(-)
MNSPPRSRRDGQDPISPTSLTAVSKLQFGSELTCPICPVCLTFMKDARTITCGHSMCKSCILNLRTLPVPARETVKCPVCRVPFSFREARELPVHTITKAVEETVTAVSESRSVKCERCDKHDAVMTCKTCDTLYCAACCALVHQGIKMRAKHIINHVTATVRKTLPTCKEKGHGDYPSDLYSPTEKKLLCCKCVKERGGSMSAYIPTLDAAAEAKIKLGDWVKDKDKSNKLFVQLVANIDHALKAVEIASDQELANLRDLAEALMMQIDRQAKRIQEQIFDRRTQEIDNLCKTRTDLVNLAAMNAQGVATAERCFTECDAVGMLEACNKFVDPVESTSIHLPAYHLPVVGPAMSIPECLALEWTTAEDQIFSNRKMDPNWQLIPGPGGNGKVLHNTASGSGGELVQWGGTPAVPTVPLTESNSEPSHSHETAKERRESFQGTFQKQNWYLDSTECGFHVEIERNGRIARSNKDSYDNTSVLGTEPMDKGVWCWKIMLLSPQPGKKILFGVTLKPFPHTTAAQNRLWGWNSIGQSLPQLNAIPTKKSESITQLQKGDAVWLQLDCNSHKLMCFWPSKNKTEVVKLGDRSVGRIFYPVVTLGGNGCRVEISPAQQWPLFNEQHSLSSMST